MLRDHPDPDLCAHLASDLRDARFTAAALEEAWGTEAQQAQERGIPAPALRALCGRTDPLASLARLFVLGRPEPVVHLDAALPRTGSPTLEALGLAHRDGEQLVPLAHLRPQRLGGTDVWVASDLDEAARGGPLPLDHVVGIGGASRTLAGLQVPTSARRVLDLGTGCGVQALVAAEYADLVVATDISARAVRYARLNAALAGATRIEVRSGDLFAPVAGERFDRIISNPPFVITPRVEGVPEYDYRDGGEVGDALLARVIAGLGVHLDPGGIAQLLGNWEYRGGHDGPERVREWVRASAVPLDVWLIEREVLTPLDYAQLWVRDGGIVPGTAEYAGMVDAWLEDFASRDVSAIGFGYLLLRRRGPDAAAWERIERVESAAATELGADIARALAVQDALAPLSDAEWAAICVRTAADVTEHRHFVPGEDSPRVIELRQGRGLGRTLSVDPGLAAVVGACDGDLPLGVLIDAVADLLEVESAALRGDLLPRLRELALLGFVDPV